MPARGNSIPDSPEVGLPAPGFRLPAVHGKLGDTCELTLSDFQGRWLVMLFYPRDFSMVCPTEITSLNSQLDDFAKLDCDLLAINTDSLETHRRWMAASAKQGGIGELGFPLATDESGEVCRTYAVYDSRQHSAKRGVFIIDPEGILQYIAVHSQNVGRGTADLLRMLTALQSGGLCPTGWKPDSPNLAVIELLVPGRLVSNYEIVREIAHGAFGVVFEAFDRSLQRPVALKLLRSPRQRSAEKLLFEARTAAALNHPNVCTIYAVDDSVGFPMIVMELLEGDTLEAILERGPVPLQTLLDWGKQIATGLSAAHAAGLAHGDLKPGNLIVLPSGIIKILDFGLSRPVETNEQSTEPTGIYGTPAYMSPEQTIGQRPGPASDIFALGSILYEMSTGRTLVDGTDLVSLFECINMINAEEVAAEFAPPLRPVFAKALQQDVAQRTLSAEEIATLLDTQR